MQIRPVVVLSGEIPENKTIIYLLPEGKTDSLPLSKTEKSYLKKKEVLHEQVVIIPSLTHPAMVVRTGSGNANCPASEELRRHGARAQKFLTENHISECVVRDLSEQPGLALAFLEGLILSNYQFLKYFSDKKELQYKLNKCFLISPSLTEDDLIQFVHLMEAVFMARDLVNEPLSFLTAIQLSKEFEKLGEQAGFSVEVFNKKKIESLRMGGLLAVNKGSIDPPTFSIMEWKPENPLNEKPYILVGKGVVYDTGGLSLKPTKNSMDSMKSDMAGAAVVAGTLYALAANRMPFHVIGLVPATDNRPDGNAYTPGDVIQMHDGTTVEVLNTDAEGRMILADALSYAKKFNPELVIELSTLTGAASMAIGPHGIVGMGNADPEIFKKLTYCGNEVYERIVEFPFWEEYREQLKSDIADLKNIGGREGGAISAGKFLEHFTDYPYIHLDIAGPAFLMKDIHYCRKGGTGFGIRVLVRFFEELLP